MAFHLQLDWHPLVGKEVAIRRNGSVIRSGKVEAVTQDNGVLWLNLDGTDTRQLFERAEGFEAWIEYKWESCGRTDQEMTMT